MVTIKLDFGPIQKMITKQLIEEMIQWQPRRMKLSVEWPVPLHEPPTPDKDWSLVLPFCETLKNAFEVICSTSHIGLRKGREDRCYTFFQGLQEETDDFDHVEQCIKTIGSFVAIRDCLALSFAIDYDKEEGDPARNRTAIGSLRKAAKTYGRAPTPRAYSAGDRLIEACLQTFRDLTCYDSATCIVAIPPSDTKKPFDLPQYLADGISKGLGKADKTEAVQTITVRPASKEILLKDKFSSIEGTIEVDKDSIQNEIVLLIDDLYQSGVTMNYVAMLLLEAGAKKVFGLSCEKTCSNDDNVCRR